MSVLAGDSFFFDFVLKLDVLRFEARYEQGPTAAPTVVIRVRAALNRASDHAPIGDRTFEVKVPAADNRIGAIAGGFDQATSQVLGQVVQWVGETGT